MTSSQDFTPEGFNVLGQRVSLLEDRQIDLRLAVSSLIETVNLHQANFEVMQRRAEERDREMNLKFEIFVTAIETIQSEVKEIQSEVRGLQAENRRILDYLLGQQGQRDDDSPNPTQPI
jgi:hypothetical protein